MPGCDCTCKFVRAFARGTSVEFSLELAFVHHLTYANIYVLFACLSTPCSAVRNLQAVFSRKFTKVRMRMTSLTDERVKLTNQAVTGARFMKINAWEPALEN